MQDKNTLTIMGMVNVIEKSHEFHGEQFYRIMLDVIRLSQNVDTVPIIVSEKLLFNNEITPGMFIEVQGQIRTKNHKEGNAKSKLLVFGYASDVEKITEEQIFASDVKNLVVMEGHVCKLPTHRRTNTGRIITDLLIACNRQYSKSDYIPCITWGVTAKMAKKLRVGDKIKFIGRFQSREYRRKNDEAGIINTAYEISILSMELVPENDDTVEVPALALEIPSLASEGAEGMAKWAFTNRGVVFKEAV